MSGRVKKLKATRQPKAPAKLPRQKWLDRRLILSPLYYVLCLSEKAYHYECKSSGVKVGDWGDWQGTPQAGATVNFLEDRAGKPLAIVCMRDWEGRTPVEVYGLLVHEAVHIFQRTCSHMGERAPSAEFEAYSIQCISQELIHSYHQQTGKI